MAFDLYQQGFGSNPRHQSVHPFRNIGAAGSNMNNQWASDIRQSSYGLEPPDYDYHSGPPVHVPSGGSYSYHATTGTGYGPPATPVAQPPAQTTGGQGGGGGRKGIFGGGDKRNNSAMSALTLLSFLFFINLLQGCIKDHMEVMNPTVMVMTTNVIRNRFNKMDEVNSREQSVHSSNDANTVVQPVDLASAAAAQVLSVMETTRSTMNKQSPYSNNPPTYTKPIEPSLLSPQTPPSLQYIQNNSEHGVPITYAKPNYDPHKPDPYERLVHLPAQQTPTYNNHSLVAQISPYKLQPVEQQQQYYHHTEHNAQLAPQSSAPTLISKYSVTKNPFYEYQHPIISKPYNSDPANNPYDLVQHDYNYRQKYEHNMHSHQHYTPFVSTTSPYPWSSNMHSSSVVSGPFRRASIITVSPKTKWISVPAKITDRINFDMNSRLEETEKEIPHHDDRDVFQRRWN